MLVTLRGLRVKRVKLVFLSLNGAYRHTYPSQVTPSPPSPKGSFSRFNNNSPSSNFWFRKKYSTKSYYFLISILYFSYRMISQLCSYRNFLAFPSAFWSAPLLWSFFLFYPKLCLAKVKFLMVSESEKLIFSTVQPLFICVLFILAVINSRRHVLFETCWLAA